MVKSEVTKRRSAFIRLEEEIGGVVLIKSSLEREGSGRW